MLAPRAALAAIGLLPDVEIDVAGAALQFARIDAPEEDWLAVERHLSELAREAAGMAAAVPAGDLPRRAEGLARLITGRHRYRGDTDTYDDPANANLIRVVARRRGLPVALGILWLHCARAAGWGMHGIDFPGHFLVGLEPDRVGPRHRPPTARQVVVDVFAGGVPLEAGDLRTLIKHVGGTRAELGPGVLQPMSARRVLLRLQENVRVRRLRDADAAGALAATEDMMALAPDAAPLCRDAATLAAQLGRIGAAIGHLQRFLQLVPEGEAAHAARQTLDTLRQRLQ